LNDVRFATVVVDLNEVELAELGTKRLALWIVAWFLFLGGLAVALAQEDGERPAAAPESQEKPAVWPPDEARGAAPDTEMVPGAQPSPAKLEVSPDYVIGPEDVLDVEVFNVPELTKTVRVANDGFISLPLLERVKAAGYTTTELRQELEEKWGETYLQQPQVSIFVRDFHARPVSVIGAVERPGLYYLAARRSLIEVLSMAGGLGKKSSAASGRTVIVTRKGGFGDLHMTEGMRLLAPDKLEVDLSRLLYSNDDSTNIEIRPLDVVSVSKAPVIYVVGEVKKAGGFVLEDRERVTVLQALALAEGLYGNPSKKNAKIIRPAADGSRKELRINLGKIMRGKAPDIEMAANDILFVPMSASKAAVKQATSSAVSTISGLIIWRR
jgi:polysaccharide export outer membrane protein